MSVILLFAPGLVRPYPLIPAEDYRVCMDCAGAVSTLVSKAQAGHAVTRGAGDWTRALVLFTDGLGVDIKDRAAAVTLN